MDTDIPALTPDRSREPGPPCWAAREFANVNSRESSPVETRSGMGTVRPSRFYTSVDNLGTSPWPSVEDVRELLVGASD